MPKVSSSTPTVVPKGLKPYLFHGFNLNWREGEEQAVGDCILCGREGKFSVEVSTSRFRCFKCGETGNAIGIIRKLYALSFDRTSTEDYQELGGEKGIEVETMIHWGVARSITTGLFLAPGYNASGAITTVYQYSPLTRRIGAKRVWMVTPGFSHGLYGVPLYDKTKPIVHTCEGLFDGMAFWEILKKARWVDSEDPSTLVSTADPERSLLAKSNVLAVPGCEVFNPSWLPLFVGKGVNLLYDNDYPKTNEGTGVTIEPAGFRGMKKASGILYSGGDKSAPKETAFLCWKDEESGWNPDLPEGFDVRDALSTDLLLENPLEATAGPLAQRLARCQNLLERLYPIPEKWRTAAKNGHAHRSGEGASDDLIPCADYAVLTKAWRRAMRWTPGLDRALGCMLCSVLTTNLVGEQLWFEVIGPASSGKTTLMEAVSTCKQYVLSKDTIRGFYSGWRTNDGTDGSLVEKARGKTLAMKEGDAFVKAPNVQQILSEGRGIYDRVGRNDYRNNTSNEYEGLRMTWIICGTSAIREEIDTSELGARFLAVVVMEGIDDDFEDDVLWRAANSENRSMIVESNGDMRGQHPEELANAMLMTGGYVQFLRENAVELISRVELTEDNLRLCGWLGKFVSYMRARPTKKDEHQEREFGARLTKQITRLMKATAAVTNQRSATLDVISRVKHIAMDTAQGPTLSIVRLLHENVEGMEAKGIALYTGLQDDKVRKMLRFLKSIGVLDINQTPSKTGARTMVKRWVLTDRIRALYNRVSASRQPQNV
jgi:hypothetical protein